MKKEKLQSEIKKMKELHDLSNKKKKLEQDLQIISFQITNKTRKESEQIKFIEETERLQKRLVQTQLAIIGTTLAITLIIYLLNSSNSDKTQALATSLDSLRKSQVVNSRAHSILRVASDNVSRTSQFGILDPNELDAREQSRVDSQEKARQQKLAIKKHMHDDLVAKSLNGSKTLADIYNSFDLED